VTPLGRALNRVEAMRGGLFPWVPVFFGSGIGGYFLLPDEPALLAYPGLAGLVLVVLALGWWAGGGLAPLATALALVAAGVLVAGVRAHMVAAPVLSFRYYGPVEGRVVAIDRSVSDAVRLTLDQVRLADLPPDRTPARVRVALHGDQGYLTPEPGLRVGMTAHLSAPEGPVEPGGFDFARMAWFRQIGAVGYTRSPALAIAPAAEGRTGLALHRLRARISAWIQARMPGEAGAFAAAITAGDRTAMARRTIDALRASNLAHLLAISGLHMGLLTGFVYAAMRYALALVPPLVLRFDTRKIAAMAAMAAGGFYLALSGGNVATTRAFVMVACMFTAILFDRRALTLRSVSLAAVVILTLSPEALTEPGFQMSFAATTALVAVFGWLRGWPGRGFPRWVRPVLAVVISSAVAGAATAPFGAAHFNQVSYYGLAANLLAVPVMGAVVMPAAVLAALLAPLGLAQLALAPMGWAIDWILAVAHGVASLDGAVGHVPAPPPAVLPLIALGGVMAVLFTSRAGRAAGMAAMAVGLAFWSQVERPDLLIAQSGRLIGVMTEAGRVLNKPTGEGFSATSWLENDGDGAGQEEAHARAGFAGAKGRLRFALPGLVGLHLSGRGAEEMVDDACAAAQLVILAKSYEGDPPTGCLFLDTKALSDRGPVALFLEDGDLRLVSTADTTGRRLWTRAGRAPGESRAPRPRQ
jgi:competence protein ComEC